MKRWEKVSVEFEVDVRRSFGEAVGCLAGSQVKRGRDSAQPRHNPSSFLSSLQYISICSLLLYCFVCLTSLLRIIRLLLSSA
jgi:hypothetical protein